MREFKAGRFLIILIYFVAGMAGGITGGDVMGAHARRREAILPELNVEANRNKVLHVLAYMRDYSSLCGTSDTVHLFREKLVDYMLPANPHVRFRGWSLPRTLLSRSYYRFTDANGLDSVSDECPWHFSWTDWMALPPLERMPDRLCGRDVAADTLFGKYSPCVKWDKHGDKVRVDINALAAPEGRKWAPTFSSFFDKEMEFDSFRMTFDYDNVVGYELSPSDITHYTYSLESNGRGHEMERIPRHKGSQWVRTSGEVFVLDREYLSPKEAKTWADFKFDEDDVGLFEPADAPPLNAETLSLIKRVEEVDKKGIRLALPPDERLICIYWGKRKQNLGDRVLQLFKQMTGISLYKSRKQAKRGWAEFKKEQIQRNRSRQPQE